MAEYSIKDLERLSGIKAHTIRMWEKRYDLIAPSRSCFNVRCYCEKELKHLLNIAMLNKHGHRISKIAVMERNQIANEVKEIVDQDRPMSGCIGQLTTAMVDMDRQKFDEMLSGCTQTYGVEHTWVGVVYPFLEKVGLLWQLNSVHAAQQYFAHNLIRQKLIVEIDKASQKTAINRKVFLLFLPKGSTNELGILFYHYLISDQGHDVVYLGADIPLDQFTQVAEWHKPNYVLTTAKGTDTSKELSKYFAGLSNKLNGVKFILLNPTGAPINEKSDHLTVVNGISQFRKEFL
ncbi:MAG: methanogenic corrinoid protein MtbC1 [Granulosicoccus sp.]|jgi:methanogenic corrinoid protein MtbC1